MIFTGRKILYIKYSVKNKPNSQKGTKRHKKEMKKAKGREKRYETKRVMDLIVSITHC